MTSDMRQINRKELEVILEKVFSTKNNKEWISKLLDNGIPAGPIYNMKEVWEDDHVNSRNMNIKIDHPNLKNSQNIGIVAKLKSTPGQIKTPAPLYGEHTEEILQELDYTESEISNLIQKKIAGMK
jgi:crotonobetainyl-CoA:carnitine CoA-transferase CaiB-like acyl-CoA transferase